MPGQRARGAEFVDVDGRQVRLTHPDRQLYPESGTTKRDVVDYYLAIAPTMLPHIAGRPVTRKRWPDGVDSDPFFEKNAPAAMPEWVATRTRHQSRRDVRYPMVADAAALVWLAQLAALELHVPQWRFDGSGRELPPDRLVLDLDPGPGAELHDCAMVALAIRDALGAHGESLVPVTSGSKGIHLYLGLNGSMTSEEASDWAHDLARSMERAHPDLVVSRMTKSLRAHKVFMDWSQNSREKTTVAPYSLRGRAAPTVAAPRTWEDIEDPALEQLEFRTVLRRVAEHGDPMAELGVAADSGGPSTVRKRAAVPDMSQPDDAGRPRDRLEVYRSKRHPERTPEPVPAAPADRQGGDGPTRKGARPTRSRRDGATGHGTQSAPTFVIQEHHARQRHWDFRLEHDGVLVSWAVPKGVPRSSEVQRLAVQTEDHPLDYASFAGTIPRGEYGAGEVSIWDSGTFEGEKWRDDEIIVALDGRRVRGRYVLIRTGESNWLMRRMKDQTGIAPRTTHQPAPSPGMGPSPRIPPMLARLGTLDDVRGAGWQFEGKWDGVRGIVAVDGDAVSVRTRSGQDATATYPELGELTEALRGHDVILDGEVVALDANGAPSFGLLQPRMGLTGPREVAAARARQEAHFYVFDVLFLDGVDLTGKALADRRRVLEHLRIDTEHCRVPALLGGGAARALATSRRRKLEGIVAKRTHSRYEPGRRPGTWVKVKFRNTQDVVVVGWRPGKGRRSGGIGSLLVALPEANGLRYAGRVGTGFGQEMLDQLATRLSPLRRATSPVADSVPAADARDAVWVTPTVVGEVTFAEFTADRRLRQASWRGIRSDIAPGEVRRDPSTA